jgi:hypothetical protein
MSNIANSPRAAAQREVLALASMVLGSTDPRVAALREALIAGPGAEGQLRGLLDSLPPLLARHIQAVLEGGRH